MITLSTKFIKQQNKTVFTVTIHDGDLELIKPDEIDRFILERTPENIADVLLQLHVLAVNLEKEYGETEALQTTSQATA
jgi:hypothetical protein